ncbi:hypothetical protein PTW37_17160 (plasmid) [Arthrobacter agilis]|nr:hypothetical protein [Arthrobacter agilis]WDF35203.1 hypothetical protein PTW37_17160 [Arthrobacter agilis]
MRTDEKTKLFHVVLTCPLEFTRVTIESHTEGKIEVETVELEYAINAFWQRASLYLNETAVCVDQVICLRSWRWQRTAVNGQRQPFAYFALNSSRRTRDTTPGELSLNLSLQIEKFRECQGFDVKIDHEFTVLVPKVN